MLQQLMMGVGNLAQVDSAEFDGTNDYMTRGAGLSGAADSKTGILSCWIRIDGGDGATRVIFSAATTLAGNTLSGGLQLIATNKFQLFLESAVSGLTGMDLRSVAAYAAGATWLHVLASWDVATASHFYLNDVSDQSVLTLTNETIDYTKADWSVGAKPGNNLKMNACVAELYFAPGQFLDFSVIANRRLFISPTGKPVQLGLTGSLPTGTAPLVYCHLAPGEAVADFATNRGTGGDFTITGTLTTGSTSPSN